MCNSVVVGIFTKLCNHPALSFNWRILLKKIFQNTMSEKYFFCLLTLFLVFLGRGVRFIKLYKPFSHNSIYIASFSVADENSDAKLEMMSV